MALSKAKIENSQGIRARNFHLIDTIYRCKSCESLQHHPKQFHCCGARLCRFCATITLPDSRPFICPFCYKQQPHKEISDDRGFLRDLYKVKVECYACSWVGSYKDYLEHLENEHSDFECSDCHERFYTLNMREEHRQLNCKFRPIQCPVPGCNTSIKSVDVDQHYLTSEHQISIVRMIVENIYEFQHNSKNHRREQMTFILEKLDLVRPGIDVLSDICHKVRDESNQSKTKSMKLMSDLDETRKQIIEVNEKTVLQEQLQHQLLTHIEQTKVLYTFTHLRLLDSDGMIILSFDKTNEGITSLFSIDSSKFKTSPYGYVFKIRVFTTVNSEDENERFLSVSIRIFRSEYDPVLVYPFPYNITVSLCDQSKNHHDISKVIQASQHTASFARPGDDENDEVTLFKFCPLKYLTKTNSAYFKDDAFFIRLQFNFLEILTSALI